MKKILCSLAVLMATVCGSANAATVSFLGVLDNGVAGPILGSVPRDFVLTLDYTINPGGGVTPASGQFDFRTTPNPGGTPDPYPGVSAVTSGFITVADNNGQGGTDSFTFNASIPAGEISNNGSPVNYSFTFLKPNDTIDSNAVNPLNIEKLIAGETFIAFANPQITANGSIRGAPEPATMVALTGLVLGGCGVGYRRRRKAKAEKDSEEADA